MLELVILRRPHLMLADVRRDDRFALRRLVNHLDDLLRLQFRVRILVTERTLPSSIRFSLRSTPPFAPVCPLSATPLSSTSLTSPDARDIDVGTFLPISAGSMSIWAIVSPSARNRPASSSPGRRNARRWRSTGRSFASPCSPHKCRACPACRSTVRWPLGKPPRPSSVVATGIRVLSANSSSSSVASGIYDAAAGEDHRPLRFLDRLQQFVDLQLVRHHRRIVAAQAHRFGHSGTPSLARKHLSEYRSVPVLCGRSKRCGTPRG